VRGRGDSFATRCSKLGGAHRLQLILPVSLPFPSPSRPSSTSSSCKQLPKNTEREGEREQLIPLGLGTDSCSWSKNLISTVAAGSFPRFLVWLGRITRRKETPEGLTRQKSLSLVSQSGGSVCSYPHGSTIRPALSSLPLPVHPPHSHIHPSCRPHFSDRFRILEVEAYRCRRRPLRQLQVPV
jgi:hypothetical protein